MSYFTLCEHLAAAGRDVPASGDGCIECLALGRDDWVHLRLCLSCGHVGCCDSSPLKHASAHFDSSRHPVVRSYELGETWRWCFVHQQIG
ncbi:MAG TPA: UBP-type zinc finger domain-containing protein [Micromonosporaceae bacterium]|nr:UBP-type zinc finger domain-containing protein [Micromonosporaceae bacterium]